jgi:hypothetical protein
MIIYNSIGYLSNVFITDLSMNTMDLSMNIITETETLLRIIDNNLAKYHATKSGILTFLLYYKSKEDFDYIFNVCELWKPRNLRIQYIGNVILQNNANIMVSLTTNVPKLHTGTYNDNGVNFVI